MHACVVFIIDMMMRGIVVFDSAGLKGISKGPVVGKQVRTSFQRKGSFHSANYHTSRKVHDTNANGGLGVDDDVR